MRMYIKDGEHIGNHISNGNSYVVINEKQNVYSVFDGISKVMEGIIADLSDIERIRETCL